MLFTMTGYLLSLNFYGLQLCKLKKDTHQDLWSNPGKHLRKFQGAAGHRDASPQGQAGPGTWQLLLVGAVPAVLFKEVQSQCKQVLNTSESPFLQQAGFCLFLSFWDAEHRENSRFLTINSFPLQIFSLEPHLGKLHLHNTCNLVKALLYLLFCWVGSSQAPDRELSPCFA